MEFKLFVLELLYMKLSQKKIIAKIKSYFKSKKEVIAIYLYGSYARNEQKKDSDIDLAILFENENLNRLSLRINYSFELSDIFSKEVEIQDLSICKIDFAYRVLQEGKLLLSYNEHKRIQFEVHTMNVYFDLKPLFNEYYEVLKKQSLKGNFYA